MITDTFKLDGKMAVVTGGGRGIGAAVAVGLAEAGADVVLGARTADEIDQVAAEIVGLGRRAVAVPGDLTDREQLAQLVTTATDQLGGIDIVVNNVGGAFPRPFLDTSEGYFERTLSFNVTTAFNLTQLATPALLESGGASVINIASTAGLFAVRGLAAYGTAKAAMIHLTRELAQDLAPKIRVNAVCPGSVATPALQTVLEDERLEKAMASAIPMRRIGEPWEIAAAVVYFASPAASYTTGQVLAVSGGIQGSPLDMGIEDL